MRLLTYAILIGLLAGCGEVSYKMGGSPQDIARAHQTCRGSGDQLADCLAANGWQKPKVDALDPLFATIEVTDNQQASQAKPSPFIELHKDHAGERTPQAELPVVAKMQPPPVSATVKTATSQSEMAAAVSPPASTAKDGPDVTYSINSWWKMGAFPTQLNQDQASCERTLGPDYLPDYKTQTFKRAFVACMHDLGWMAIRNIK